MKNYFNKQVDSDSKEISIKIKQWVKTYFRLPDEGCVVMVSELTCADEGCPDIETVISILMKPEAKILKINKPTALIRIHDIQALGEKHLAENII
ncbi:MAG: hypothetical protein H0U95_13970 [Bacteroidetes bacterium]|nr:hypothetical protein [Bacteroidota bacterium]